MSRYKTIFEFSRPEFLSDVQISRLEDQGMLSVWMQAENDEEGKSIELSGFDELADSVSDLLQAEHVCISEELGTGKEFGTIRIECWVDGSYSEFRCDSAIL